MKNAEQGSLRSRAVRAVAWGYGGTFARMGLQVVAQAILARALGPAEFGVFAALMLVIAASALASDLVTAPLIHAQTLDDGIVSFGCAVQWTGALVVALLSLATLPLFQSSFPAVDGLWLSLCMVSAGIFVTGWGGVALSLLRRNLRYREIQLAQLIGYFVGYVLVAMPLVLLGFKSHHVLVLAWLGQAVVGAGLQYHWERHALRASWAYAGWRQFVRYGGVVCVGNLANWFTSSIDRLLVARHAAPAHIGYYLTMLNLMLTPVTQLSSSLNTVVFSLAAQADDGARRRGSLAYLNLNLLVFGLFYAVFAAAPTLWVHLLYGPKWIDAAAYLPPFALLAIGFGLSGAANALLTSDGKATSSTLVQLATALLIGLLTWHALQRSAIWAAWTAGVIYMLRGLVLAAVALRRVDANTTDVLQVLGTPLLSLALQITIARVLCLHLQARGVSVIGAEAVASGIAICVVPLLLVMLRRTLMPIPTLYILRSIFSGLRARIICRGRW